MNKKDKEIQGVHTDLNQLSAVQWKLAELETLPSSKSDINRPVYLGEKVVREKE